ncbi:MAG TPA: hypothetical protein DCY89_05605 [Gammaproteobacteria bacterium]|nr:hypothetical protein [Gammaproteobacteria bacterium]
MRIERAGPGDVDALLEMAAPYHAHSGLGEYLPLDVPATREALRGLTMTPDTMLAPSDHLLLVARHGAAALAGGLYAQVTAPWAAPRSRVVTVCGWWVHERHRGSAAGVRLLRAAEAWGREGGASAVVVSDLVRGSGARVGELVQQLGYAMVERAHIKRLRG